MSTLTGELNIVQNLTGEINKNLEYVTPELQEKIATPTKQTQNITPDANYDALSKVVVNPIPNEYIIPNLQEKTITPSNQIQNVTPDSNYNGFSKVVVNAIPGGALDWTALGYSGTPQKIIDDYNYSKNIYDNWDSTQTSCQAKFQYDRKLVYMPAVDTSNVTSFQNMFGDCSSLTTVPQLDMSNATNIQGMFSYDSLLEDMGGFKNLGQSYSTGRQENYTYYTLNLATARQLTHESLMNIINNLYDIASLGCNKQKLGIGETNLAKLTAEEIAIATNKGWNVS